MFSLRSPFRMVLVAAIMLALATTLWLSAGERVAVAQGTITCAPTATDQVYAPSIEVVGTELTWDAHPDACAYRVFLSASPSGERVDTLENTADTTYTMPSGSMVTGKKYRLTIRVLDAEGRPAGLETRYWFHFHPDLPQCAISLDSSVAAVPTPTPNPTLASSSCNLLPAQKDVAVVVSGDPDASAAITPVLSYATSKIRRAAQSLKCTSSGTCSSDAEGITAIDGSIMTQAPRKPTAGWAGYHNFNNMSVSNPAKSAIDCSTANRDGDLDGTDDDDEADDKLTEVPYTGPESIVVGFVTGDFAGRIYQNELLVAAYYHDQQLTGQTNNLRCVLKRTHIQNDQHKGIYVQIGHIGSGWWAVRAWYDEWVEIARFHTSWEEAPAASHGHEIWADNLHFHQVPAPLNQISRVSLTIDGSRLPWYEKALPTDFRRRSQTLVVGTLAVSDNRGFDHTSITTCATKPGTNFCYAADRSLGRIRASATPAPSESDLISNMIEALSAAVSANATYLAAELGLSVCLSGTSTAKSDDTGGDSGPRAATLPFPTVTDNYGTYKSRMVDGGDCHEKAQAMFDAYETASKAELATLRSAQPRPAWADMLDHTVYGADFAEGVGNATEIWRYVDLLNLAASSSARSTRNGLPPSETGVNCVQLGDTVDDDSEELAALNCLVFDTPYRFWFNLLGSTAKNNSLAAASDKRYDWLGFENWDCTLSLDAPVPACYRHDVGWATLRNIAPNNEIVDYDHTSDDTIDKTWNIRNKYAADEKFFTDIRKYGCQGSSLISLPIWCNFSTLFQAERMLYAVRKLNNKNWPHTTEDMRHAESNPRFVECSVPVPRLTNVEMSLQPSGDYFVSWLLERSCVSDISIKSYELHWRFSFTLSGETNADSATTNVSGTALSATFRPSHHPVIPQGSSLKSVQLLWVRVAPDNKEFGGDYYPTQPITGASWHQGGN